MTDAKIDLHLFDEGQAISQSTPMQEAGGAAPSAPATADPTAAKADDSMDENYADDPAWQSYERIRNARFAARSASLARSCAQTAKMYPAFNLKEEMQNPRFLRLIDAGLSVRESYEVLHRDTLLQQAVQIASEQTRQQIYQSLAAKRTRAEENGASPALVTKRDPAAMSRLQREQIAKRVMRGEKVTF